MTSASKAELTRCCIYARVSTEEQAEKDLSIPFQLERCRYHAQGSGWSIVSEFVDAGESARTDRRPQFQEMIAAARAQQFQVILVHKFDRFARNDYDFIVYEKELEELGIAIESISEPGDVSTPAGYISRRMMQIISTWYSKNLSIEVKKGMLKSVENGGWPKTAPLGYLNKHDDNSAWIEVDPKNGPLITEAFHEMASGKWTLAEWADHAFASGYRSRRGGRIGKQAWSNIFHHRFYLGETWLKAGEDVPQKGAHQPLIDESTFTAVQQVLRKHDKYKQRTQRHKYLLSGLLHSCDSDSPCWVETHPKKRISYYRTRAKVNGKHIYYNTRDVDVQVGNIFKDITITEKARRQLRKEIAAWFANEDKGNDRLEKATERMAKLQKMEKNLQRLAIEGELSIEDFKEHRRQIEGEKAKLTNTIDGIKQRHRLVKADFEIALQLATELDFLFDKGNIDEKKLLCQTVFKRLYVKEGKIADMDFNSPFGLITSSAKGSESVLSGGRYWI